MPQSKGRRRKRIGVKHSDTPRGNISNPNREKGVIYHYGTITSAMAKQYLWSLQNTKPAFRNSFWHDQFDYFVQFI